ncbi:hypothetical protein KFE25_014415 [Diacronema lutheri]|uniref:RING-CH-type domain-containing protein n=1 Tax=Diacronema lutheri TaxID=2081491 RepID=A0A8J5XAN8_DIALT|nr:hypothetical protein KFE25_014415 [Diacronema lutheri]
MEDQDDAKAAPLAAVCACTSTCVHAVCLEKMLNSKKARERPLAVRMTCAVCTQPYAVPLTLHILEPHRPGRCARMMLSPVGARCCPLLLISAFFAIIALVVWLVGQYNSLLAMAVLLSLIAPLLVIQRMRALRNRDFTTLDDNRFHASAVARAHKEVARGLETPNAEAMTSRDPGRVIILVRPAGRPPARSATDAQPAGDRARRTSVTRAPPPPPPTGAAGGAVVAGQRGVEHAV